MTEHKVACPQCHSALKSSRPIPGGMRVKCPRCQTQFTTPGDLSLAAASVPAAAAGAIRAPGSAPAMLLAPAASPEFSANPPAPPPAPPAAAPAQPTVRAPGLGRGAKIGIVAGGTAVVAALAVILVIVCFSGDDPAPSPSTDPGEGQPVAQPVAVQKPPAPPLTVLPPEVQKKVDQAVDTGVAYLKKWQRADGQWPGFPKNAIGLTSLAGLTLLEAGVPANDPVVARAVKVVRDRGPTLNLTYDITLAILFLNRLGDLSDRKLIQQLTLRLVAGQTRSGGWSYACPVLTEEQHSELYALLNDLKHKTPAQVLSESNGKAAALQRKRPLAILTPEPAKGAKAPKAFYRVGGDNSNTQFAIIALWAARGHDIPLDPTLSLLSKRFHKSQFPDGHWAYSGPREVSHVVPGKGHLPTMTCAGLLGVAVGFGLQQDPGKGGMRPEQDPVVVKGLEHLARFVGDPSEIPPGTRPPMQEMYFLWSVERVAVLYQLKTIHGKKWYEWGVDVLTKNQAPNGSWKGGGHGTAITDTCFAILFLRRVNLAKDLTDKLNELRAGVAVGGGRPPARKD